MLRVREIGADVVEVTLSGVVDRADIAGLEQALGPKLEREGPMGLIVRAEDWADITADALAAEARFELSKLARWSVFARMAVVSDLQAIGAILAWVDPLMPMIEMRRFDAAQASEAEAWVSDLPDRVTARSAQSGAVTVLSDGSDGLLAFEIDGRITPEDVDRMLAPLAPHLEEGRKVNLLVRIASFDGFDPSILTRSLMGTKFDAMSHLGRYALIGAPPWMAAIAGTVGGMMPFGLRLFDAKDEDAAWAWARGG
ncbi:STAS/SEC14 domain-containing protein [Palleronia sediminis]|uniref:STAS/SEC14 domain-containing protein n=1 Tax=Palleronia sediminis TaxID=2547833 RepID=A0A4R6AEG9_9RHOB|nr:STAS/SEC14 domain-containing protein [Palleronia sediminis]TDL79643.1 STAS/SEC14 domain-containing protein [Palleronia sediminis]